MTMKIPHLRRTAQSQQLVVQGEPFLMLAGEVQNSQFSSAKYMRDVWPRLKQANLNTVFGSVAWEQVEAVEGTFCFDEVDGIIADARQHGFRLVLLWFGSFKNGLSSYAPAWVKRDAIRFPRAELADAQRGTTLADVVSIFGKEAVDADARAFAAFMAHLREVDEQHSTVIMVQVENEVGLLGDSRDRSRLAEAAWKQPVPQKLLDEIQHGWSSFNKTFRSNHPMLCSMNRTAATTWADLPGDPQLVEELFMAYHYALYVERVTAAGKAAYQLPMYTNVWQNYIGEDKDDNTDAPAVVAGGGKPGDYPCGGGVTNVLDIWQLFAPSLDLIAPDVYLNDYSASCANYRHRGQALLIPEQRRDEYGARRIWAAFGSYQCLGTAPFGIDTSALEENPVRKHYGLLSRMSKFILKAQGQGDCSIGFFFDEIADAQPDKASRITKIFGSWRLTVERSFVFGKPGPGCGIVIHNPHEDDVDQFLLIGWGFQVSFESTNPSSRFTGLLTFEEKEVVDGALRTLRLLNGDETRSGKSAVMPNEDPDYGGFPIAITIPANTGIATCKPYCLI